MALDNFKVVDISSGRDLTVQLHDQTFQFIRERGIYPIFSDRYVQEYRQREIQIKFTGNIEGVEVISKVYKVGADCCHVYHVSGDLELVL